MENLKVEQSYVHETLRHFVTCHYCGQKFYISTPAKVRSELPDSFYLTCTNCGKQDIYYSSEVVAEVSLIGGAGGALLGGLLGLAAGGVGALLGALAGGAIGEKARQNDEQEVERFNSS